MPCPLLRVVPYGMVGAFLFGVYLLLTTCSEDIFHCVENLLAPRGHGSGMYGVAVYTVTYFALFYVWALLAIGVVLCSLGVFWGGKSVVDRISQQRR